jgi:hypothetical protein
MPTSRSYILLYMISYLFTAMPIGSVDALIPFMASAAGTYQGDYSNIYTIISFAILEAGIISPSFIA